MMQMKWLLIFLALVLTGCVGTNKDDETQEAPASDQLGGFWDGQLDQAGSLRMLIYQGEVFARDEAQGYYGSVLYSGQDQTARFVLSARAFAQNDTAAKQFATGGSVATTYQMDGLLYTVDSRAQLVGSYAAANDGNFILTQDGTWNGLSAYSSLVGRWAAEGLSLRVNTAIADKAEFVGTSETADGSPSTEACSFRGYFKLVSRSHNIYAVTLNERKNCPAFNQKGTGFATLNKDKELEFYLREESQLLFMSFSPYVAP